MKITTLRIYFVHFVMRLYFLVFILFATSCKYFKESEPLIVQSPKVTTQPAKEADSAYFSITMLEKGFEVKVQNKTATVKNGKEIDDFIEANKPLIDSNMVLIVGPPNASYEKFKTILDVIKKRGYYKFQMITK